MTFLSTSGAKGIKLKRDYKISLQEKICFQESQNPQLNSEILRFHNEFNQVPQNFNFSALIMKNNPQSSHNLDSGNIKFIQ